MADYLFNPDAPVYTEEELQNLPRRVTSTDNRLFSSDELDSVTKVPSVDVSAYDKSLSKLGFAAQGFKQSLAESTMGSVGHTIFMTGYSADKFIDSIDGPNSSGSEIAKKMRDFGLALRSKAKEMEGEQVQPGTYGEKLATSIGGGTASWLSMLAPVAMGAGTGFLMGGPAGAVAGGVIGRVGSLAVSKGAEQVGMYDTLKAAGYDVEKANQIADFYSGLVAPIDFIGMNVAMGWMKGPLRKLAVSSAAKMGALAVTEGVIAEGGTEVIQGVIQEGFELGARTKAFDMAQFLEDRSLEFITGGLLGGAGGLAGQRQSRNDMIDTLQKQTGISKAAAVSTVDQYLLSLNELTYDTLAENADITERMASINTELAKLHGQDPSVTAPILSGEETTAEEYSTTGKIVDSLIDAEGILTDAKSRESLREVTNIQKEQVRLQKAAADLIRERRLVAINPEEAFRKENGRAPSEGELGQWATDRAIRLENAVQKAEESIGQIEERLAVARSAFAGGIKGLPGAEKLAELEKTLQQKYNRQQELLSIMTEEMVPSSIIEKTSEKQKSEGASALIPVTEGMRQEAAAELQDLNTQIAAAELRLGNAKNAPETVKAAEAVVDKLTEQLIFKGQEVDDLSGKLAAVRNDGLTEFVTEKGRQPKEGEIEAWVKSKQDTITNEMQRLQTEADKLYGDIVRSEAIAEAFRSGEQRVTGNVQLTASQVRQMAAKDLRNVITAFKAGRKFTLAEVKTVHKAFRTMMTGLKLSPKLGRQILTFVLSTRTEAQFNAKAPMMVEKIQRILNAELVAKYQKFAGKILDRMVTEGKVLPETQKFGAHLMRVFNGKIMPQHDIFSTDPQEVAKANVEQMVYTLSNNTGDVMASRMAATALAKTLSDMYQAHQNWLDSRAATRERLGDITVKALEAGNLTKEKVGDAAEQALKNARAELKDIPVWSWVHLTHSFESIIRVIARGQTQDKVGTSEVERELSPLRANMAYTIGISRAKQFIDRKLAEIYKGGFQNILSEYLGKDFVEVVFSDDRDNIAISRGQAMELYMMLQMPKVRQDIIEHNLISEGWVEAFENGTIGQFSTEDYTFMDHARQVLDQYFSLIAPVYQKQTGRVLNGIDQYFMTRRLHDSSKVEDMSLLDMVAKDQLELSPEDKRNLMARTGGKMPFVIGDIFTSLSRYALDMEHFLAYTGYVQRLRWIFDNPNVRARINRYIGNGYDSIIDKFIDNMAKGSNVAAERRAMSKMYSVLGHYARTKIAPVKNIFRQATGLAAFTDIPGIGAREIIQAAVSLAEDHKTEAFKNFLNSRYMDERYRGAFEYVVKYVQEQAKYDWYASARRPGAATKIKKALASKAITEITTLSSRLGDRFSSIIGGWAVYKTEMAKHGDSNLATMKALEAIDKTQQSLYETSLPQVYSETAWAWRLMTLFGRTPAMYLDRYQQVFRDAKFTIQKEGLGAFSAFKEGSGRSRISYKDLARTFMTYHIWVPLFETMMTSGGWDWEEAGVNAALGPIAYHMIFGRFVMNMIALTAEQINPDVELPKFMKTAETNHIMDTLWRDMGKMYKAIEEVSEYPDYDTMWNAVKMTGRIADITGVPFGYMLRATEGLYDLFQQDIEKMGEGAKLILGYSEYQAGK